MPKKRVKAVSQVIETNGKPDAVIHRFSCHDPLSWALMPQLLTRVSEFCTRIGTDLSPEIVVPNLRQYFATDNQIVAAWGVLVGNRIVGHLLAQKEQYGDTVYALVLQAETDDVRPQDTIKVWNAAKAWARESGASEIRVVTARDPEGFVRRYGFTPRQHILSCPLGEHT